MMASPTTAASTTPPATLRVALIGLGAIGRVLASELHAIGETAPRSPGGAPPVALVGVLVRSPPGPGALPPGVAAVSCLADLLALRPHVVVEAAGHAAVAAHGAACLAAGCDLLLASVGALADAALLQSLDDAARTHGRQVLLPAGALAGLDWLVAAQAAGLQRVAYRGRKPPAAWAGTAAEAVLSLDAVHTPQTFFRGTAREAARLYPKNANVAATLALATLGLDAVTVELIADPQAGGNVHELEAEGVAGRLSLQVANAAMPANPRSSLITPFSLLRSIMARCAGVVA